MQQQKQLSVFFEAGKVEQVSPSVLCQSVEGSDPQPSGPHNEKEIKTNPVYSTPHNTIQ